MEVTIPNDFSPRPYELDVMRYLDNGGKRAFLCWHRRAGKDLTMAHQTCKMMHRRIGLYWHIFPTAEQGRKALWNGFNADGKAKMEQVFPRPIRKRPLQWTPNAPMVVELVNGSKWQLIGSDHIDVVGAGPIGTVLSEYALGKPNTWDLIRPMLRENGGWAVLNTTPRGKNHAYQQFLKAQEQEGWFTQLLTVHDTGLQYRSSHSDAILDPLEMMEEERRDGMPDELIRQEYLCDWAAALVGSYFGDLLEMLEKRGGLNPFEHEPGDAFTWWDLGIDDSTAMWLFQLNHLGGVDIIDYYENNGKPWSHYMDECEQREELHNVRVRSHWLPHDCKKRELTGTSVLEMSRQRWGTDKVLVGPRLDNFPDSIQAGRYLLQGSTRIHPRCNEHHGIDALRNYHKEWDDEKKCFTERPVHDWSSHGADAFRGLGVVIRVTEMLSKPTPSHPKRSSLDRRPILVNSKGKLTATLDAMWKDHERRRR